MPLDQNSLEISRYWQEWWKVGVSALTPLMIAILTYYISNSLNEKQSLLRKGEQIILEKQKIYAAIGEKLNIIFVYVADIGDFRIYSPETIVENKREVDRKFFMYGPYWSDETKLHYNKFMLAAFSMYTGSGQNAKIRSTLHEKISSYKFDKREWNNDWNSFFTGEQDSTVKEKYEILVGSLLNDIVTSDIYSPK